MILLIYGSGGLGHEVYDIAKRINDKENRWSEISFIDDVRAEDNLNGVNVYKFQQILSLDDLECVVAVGEPVSREKLYDKLKQHNLKIGIIVDPTAVVSESAVIEEGVIICPFVIIATGVYLHINSFVQPSAVIGHDIKIGKHSIISAGALPGGGSVFGDKVYVGMGAIIKEKVNIGENSIIGMGSCVHNDIPSDVIALGNPARVMRRNEENKIFK